MIGLVPLEGKPESCLMFLGCLSLSLLQNKGIGFNRFSSPLQLRIVWEWTGERLHETNGRNTFKGFVIETSGV